MRLSSGWLMFVMLLFLLLFVFLFVFLLLSRAPSDVIALTQSLGFL